MSRISILIVDDHAIVRDGLRQVLDQQADMTVVDEAIDGAQALKKVRQLKPDVVLLDIAMPGLSGLDAIGLIRDAAPETRIVVLSMFGKENYVKQMLGAGALGYVLKASSSSDILEAIRSAHRGEYFLSPKIKADVVQNYLQSKASLPAVSGYELLSEREQQVFRLVVEGQSTKDISDILCVSPKTVEKHRAAVFRKIGVQDRLELLKYAIKIGVVDPDLWDT